MIELEDHHLTELAPLTRMEKPWGFELLWASTEHYAGKILQINAGGRLSLQYHERKEESLYLLSGHVRLELELANGGWLDQEVGPGTCIHIAPGRHHRLTAIEVAHVLEVSTPELDDVVRVRDEYGREVFPRAR
jgi:mannose-6-phosphate isomerase